MMMSEFYNLTLIFTLSQSVSLCAGFLKAPQPYALSACVSNAAANTARRAMT
jgi:hypothetical protein